MTSGGGIGNGELEIANRKFPAADYLAQLRLQTVRYMDCRGFRTGPFLPRQGLGICFPFFAARKPCGYCFTKSAYVSITIFDGRASPGPAGGDVRVRIWNYALLNAATRNLHDGNTLPSRRRSFSGAGPESLRTGRMDFSGGGCDSKLFL